VQRIPVITFDKQYLRPTIDLKRKPPDLDFSLILDDLTAGIGKQLIGVAQHLQKAPVDILA
jgi:hypothetical protein